ncbi:hypothetical protein EDD22DRAFT_964616 [Suillus occidentalis]|nr:hypothetical protein EDD22DRAFT_964616 [Suillus occidentalis]
MLITIISGGGVGGLTLALALSQYPDIVVDVYEAAQSFYEIGAGFAIWPRAFKVLRKLGHDFEQQLLQRCGYNFTEEYVPGIQHRKSDQAVGFHLFDMVTKGNQLRFHRADFHGYFSRISRRLPDRSRKSPITLIFRDGSTATCDVLIGADGVKSAVRPCMMRELAEGMDSDSKQSVLSCSNPIWSGVTAYRTLISAEKLRARCPDHRVFSGGFTQYLGKDAFFLGYPISLGKYINIAGFTLQPDLVNTAYEADARIPRRSFEGKADSDWVGELTAEQFVKPFKNFEKEAQVLLEKKAHFGPCTP